MVHLCVHSNHSLLRGVPTVRQLVARAVEYGMKALALTDTDGLYAAIPFYRAAKDAGIKPILGAELDGVVVLARNREGYADLCRLVTAYHIDEDFALVEGLGSPDLFVLSGDRRCIRTLHARGIAPLVAVTAYDDSRSQYAAGQMVAFAKGLGLRPVALNPIYALERDQMKTHRVLSAIRCNATVDTVPEEQLAHPESWFRNGREMERLYADWPEALGNAEWVADRAIWRFRWGVHCFRNRSCPWGDAVFVFVETGFSRRERTLSPAHAGGDSAAPL